MKVVFCLVLILAFLCGCNYQPLHKDSRIMMGTFVEVISPDERAAGIVFSEIKRVENILSSYNPDSEISRLNRFDRIKASTETLLVLNKAGEFFRQTQGAFDITVAALVDLWGFKDRHYRIPTDAEINQAMGRIGFDKIRISGNIIEFDVQGMMIDLGAIAKGFAVDSAVRKLRLAGINSALVNAGGDIYCLGSKYNRPWKIAVKSQEADSSGYLELEDKAA